MSVSDSDPVSQPAPHPAFATLLGEERARRGLSQNQLAFEAGLVPSCISRLEAGKRQPTRLTVEALANALALTDTGRGHLLRAAGFWPDTPAIALAIALNESGFDRVNLTLQELLILGSSRLIAQGETR